MSQTMPAVNVSSLMLGSEEPNYMRRRWQTGGLEKRPTKNPKYWAVRPYEDFIDANGKIKRRRGSVIPIGPCAGPGKMTEKEARKRMAAIMVEVNFNSHAPQSLMTVAQFVERSFRPLHIAFCKPAGVAHYEYIIGRHVLPALGEVALRDVQPEDIRRLIAAKATTYSRETVMKIKATLHSIFQHAFESKLVQGNPAAIRIKMPEKDRARVVAYTWDEARLVLRHLKPPVSVMCLLSAGTSLNVAELCGIRVGRINLTDKPQLLGADLVQPFSIAVRENYYRGEYGSLKTGRRRRDVAIPSGLIAAVKQLAQGRKPHEPLFMARTGRPLDSHNIAARIFRPLAAKLGVRVTWHRWRHAHATFRTLLGAEAHDVQAGMGHGSQAMTARYVNTYERQKADGDLIVERLLGVEKGAVN